MKKNKHIFNIEFPVEKCQRHKPVGGIDTNFVL